MQRAIVLHLVRACVGAEHQAGGCSMLLMSDVAFRCLMLDITGAARSDRPALAEPLPRRWDGVQRARVREGVRLSRECQGKLLYLDLEFRQR